VFHFDGTAGAQHGARLNEDGDNDVVTAAGLGNELIQQVAPARSIPQVMVRIDDRQVVLKQAPGGGSGKLRARADK
jgi:hypothetical protein